MRATEARSLHSQAILAGVDPDVPATAALHISADDIAQLKSLAEQTIESGEALRLLIDDLPVSGLDVRWVDLQQEAATALQLGVADSERVQTLARCLTVRDGFRALAEMLRTTDSHRSWENTTLGDVLGRFRDADDPFVRRVTALAHLSPQTSITRCNDEQIATLADVLAKHAATARCR